MSDKFVQPIAQSNYELVPLPGAYITDGRFVRYKDDKNISDTVKDFDGKIEEASDKADALDARVTALENKPSGDDYSPLKNKPKINGVELSGNKTAEDLGLGTYNKPSGGIPKTDLAEAVQTSLGKADTALQEHQDISGKIDAPQTAEVGQVLAVKSVDASGKPTEWETVEKGGGGSGFQSFTARAGETVTVDISKYNGTSYIPLFAAGGTIRIYRLPNNTYRVHSMFIETSASEIYVSVVINGTDDSYSIGTVEKNSENPNILTLKFTSYNAYNKAWLSGSTFIILL